MCWKTSCVFVRVGASLLCSLATSSWVSQGSLLRASLFIAYVSSIHRLYLKLTSSISPSLGRLTNWSAVLAHWFWSNDLQLNPDESDVAFFETKQGLMKVGRCLLRDKTGLMKANLQPRFIVACRSVNERPKIIGVTQNSAHSFEKHVGDVVNGWVSTCAICVTYGIATPCYTDLATKFWLGCKGVQNNLAHCE